MNDLVYVMYNLKLSKRQEKKKKETSAEMQHFETLDLDDISSDDEWITEESPNLQSDEDWINILQDSTEPQADGGGGDDVFLARAIRDQFG